MSNSDPGRRPTPTNPKADDPRDGGPAADGAGTADPRPATLVMYLTYVVAGSGIFLGINGLTARHNDIALGTLLAVGGGGILSFIRHSLLHRSDAARMGWDYGHRNNFQIEVGLANLAWGIVAVLSVVLDWGTAVQAATCLTMGVYLTSVMVMQIVSPGGRRRNAAAMFALGAFGIALLGLGVAAMQVA